MATDRQDIALIRALTTPGPGGRWRRFYGEMTMNARPEIVEMKQKRRKADV